MSGTVVGLALKSTLCACMCACIVVKRAVLVTSPSNKCYERVEMVIHT